MKVTNVVGARPNFVKVAALYRAQAAHAALVPTLIHTGQHGEEVLTTRIFSELGLPAPDMSLAIDAAPPHAQFARIVELLIPALRRDPPDIVVVVGDVTSTVAAATAAHQLGIPVAHVEAGLRCGDLTMPEERNRIRTDVISALHFASESAAVDNLRREGVDPRRIHLVGNVMIDTLVLNRQRAAGLVRCSAFGLTAGEYAVATLHRRGNLDEPDIARELLAAITDLSRRMPVIFPAHPRAVAAIDALARGGSAKATRVQIVAPQSYLEMISLLMDARIIVTDSGGLQEESSFLGVPCLTLRETTERPVTLTHGTNRIAGRTAASILAALDEVLSAPVPEPQLPPHWDGKAADRIAERLALSR